MRFLALVVLSGCALHAEEASDPPCCAEAPPPEPSVGVDLAAQTERPARCAEAARQRLPIDVEAAWRQLWSCVEEGRFTALRPLLSGAWDDELRRRSDAPLLLTRVIAERGGSVDEDLPLLHERHVPLFTLAQVLGQPEQRRGALVVVRARVAASGVLDELRLVGQVDEAPMGPAERVVTLGPWPADTRSTWLRRRSYNVDVPTGHRALARLGQDPFLDPDDSVVILARFDGLRPGDLWPELSVLAHFHPNARVTY
jgi:hypothetical protein